MTEAKLHFDVSTGLKRVLGRELITDDEVAIFEMVKNSFDAGATQVHLYFDDDRIVIADNGSGMTEDDLKEKWLFVAYSAKREQNGSDFRDVITSRGYLAGSKGIGRFSSDRLGNKILLQTRPKGKSTRVHQLDVDWGLFEKDAKQHFEKVPVTYAVTRAFKTPSAVQKFAESLQNGTIIEICELRHIWSRADLQALKVALAKLINPFGSDVDKFTIRITAPNEKDQDNQIKKRAKAEGVDVSSRDLVNGKVGNFIFSDLREKTTFLISEIVDNKIESQLVDRGEIIYRIREPNPFPNLEHSGFRCEMYFLNRSAKVTFARRVGLASVSFGSVFLFRNGFRVFPIGEEHDDWFGINARKQQGYARFLGSRDLIGRVDVFGDNEAFEEASSRNQGLIDTPAVMELKRCVMDYGLKRLERYVVPVTWVDKADKESDNISRLLTDPGRARVSAAVASLVDNDDVELLAYSKRLVRLLNERSEDFEKSLVSLRAIAEKAGDKKLLTNIDAAEARFEELRESEAEARKVADRERQVALKATQRAERAEQEAAIEKRRAHFLDDAVHADVKQLLNLQHQVTIYSVSINQQIENLLSDTADVRTIPRERVLKALEQIAFLSRRIQSVSRFAALANFQLDSEKINGDLPLFLEEYISRIARSSGSTRTRIEIHNDHPGMTVKFNPMDAAIVVDNLVSNARSANAPKISFVIEQLDRSGMVMTVTDNGPGLGKGVDPKRIFEMGYSTTHGSGLGLYHVRQVLGEMNGTIDVDQNYEKRGFRVIVTIGRMGRGQ